MIIRAPHTPAEWAAYYAVRFAALRQPWGQPPGSERADDDDAPATVHAAAFAPDGGAVLGAGRLHPSGPGQGQVRFMAVADGARSQGVGGQVLRYLEQQAVAAGFSEIILHARQPAVPFYERHGYAVVEASYTLFGVIPHFLMRKTLSQSPDA